MPASIETRIITLEIKLAQIAELEDEVKVLKERLAYYDRITLKWGSVGMTLLTIGALVTMGFDKAKDKIAAWFGL